MPSIQLAKQMLYMTGGADFGFVRVHFPLGVDEVAAVRNVTFSQTLAIPAETTARAMVMFLTHKLQDPAALGDQEIRDAWATYSWIYDSLTSGAMSNQQTLNLPYAHPGYYLGGDQLFYAFTSNSGATRPSVIIQYSIVKVSLGERAAIEARTSISPTRENR